MRKPRSIDRGFAVICRQQAFSLLEMVIALAMFSLLIAGIYGISAGALELADGITLAQDRSLVRQNFLEFLRRSLRNLPGDSQLRLSVRQAAGSYLPTFNISGGGSCLTPGRVLPPSFSVDLFADTMPGGYLRVGIRVLDAKQTEAMLAGRPYRMNRDQVVLPLLENVSRFEWRVWDVQQARWVNQWKQQNRPILAELLLRLDDGLETRSVFWLPPVMTTP
jgi:prepilin-type N-terminal cleavage/methylation domain-containing protein